MMHRSRTFRVAYIASVLLLVVPLVGLSSFRTVGLQSQEPPAFGQQPLPQYNPRLVPVPVVPAPGQMAPAPTYPQQQFGPAQPQYGAPQPPVWGNRQPPVASPQPAWGNGQQPSDGAQPQWGNTQPMPRGPQLPVGLPEILAPLVKISIRVAECSPAGQSIEYVICVENCSPVPAHNVLVRNPLPANARFRFAVPDPVEVSPDIVWVLGTLNSGCTKEIKLFLMPTDNCDVTNCARVQFEHGQCVVTRLTKGPPGAPPSVPSPGTELPKGQQQPKGTESPKNQKPPRVLQPDDKSDLRLEVIGPVTHQANTPAKYHITLINNGNVAATRVLITAYLPDKSEQVESSHGGRFHHNEVAWLFIEDPLLPKEKRTVTVSFKSEMLGEFCLRATALADEGQGPSQRTISAEGKHCTTFIGASAMLLEMIDTRDPVEVGGETSYHITVTNQGSVDLTRIYVLALLPPELKFSRATGPTKVPTADKLLPPERERGGQPLPFDVLETLKPGEKQVFQIFATAIKVGDARFKVVVNADQLTGGPVMEEESTNIFREDNPPPPTPPAGGIGLSRVSQRQAGDKVTCGS
jgi:uncharacterized repeat protein (TIGR01451 family)